MNYYLIISVLSALLNILLVPAQSQSTQPRFDAQARLTKSWKSDPSSSSHFVEVPSYIIVITASTFDGKSESQVPLSNTELLIRPSSTASFLLDDLSGLIVEKKYTHEQTFKLTTNSLGRVSFSIVSPLTSIKAPGLYIRSNQMEKDKWVLMYPDVDVINQLKNLDDSVFKELNPNLTPETVKSTNELVKRVMNLAIWSDLNIEKERKVKRLVKRTLPPSTASRMMKKRDIDADKEFHYERETSAMMTWIVEDTPDNIRRELPKPKSYWVYSLSSTNSTSTSSSNSSGFNSPAAVFTPNPPRRMLRRLNKRDDDEEDDDDKLPRIPSVFDPSKDEVKSISTVPERPKGFIAIIKNSIGKLFEMVVETVKDDFIFN
ncbi:hypothetical protein BKA69DRAFT_1092048 [Paraphysoderma sedebokerense]|nr:hypothetical protein BKA69DRAFT_1092048 [Paraphysoderma sedebokerense]